MMTCLETCSFSADLECDDGGDGAEYTHCALATDCIDCGPRCVLLPPLAPPALSPSAPPLLPWGWLGVINVTSGLDTLPVALQFSYSGDVLLLADGRYTASHDAKCALTFGLESAIRTINCSHPRAEVRLSHP